jgi:hypothetical protein
MDKIMKDIEQAFIEIYIDIAYNFYFEGSSEEEEREDDQAPNYVRTKILPIVKEIERRARIDELNHISVGKLGNEVGAWYETEDGYQTKISNRISELKTLNKLGEALLKKKFKDLKSS